MSTIPDLPIGSATSAQEWEAALSQRDRRSVIFHLLYLAESYDYTSSMESLADNLNRGFDLSIALQGPLVHVANAIVEKRNELDELYVPFLDNWRLDRLSVCTKLILRYAIWELSYTDTSPTIIINEAIELSKAYAEKDAYKFINGILDKFIKRKNIATEPAAAPVQVTEEIEENK